MYRPVLGETGTLVFDVFVDLLEFTSIFLGFYAILHTSSAPLIEAEDSTMHENELMVELVVRTRAYVVGAMAMFGVVFMLRTVVRRMIATTGGD